MRRLAATCALVVALFSIATGCDKTGSDDGPAGSDDTATETTADTGSGSNDDTGGTSAADTTAGETDATTDGGAAGADIAACVQKCVRDNQMRAEPIEQIREECRQECR